MHNEKLNPDVMFELRSQDQEWSKDNSQATSPAVDSEAGDGQVGDSQVRDGQVTDDQARDSQAGDSQAEDSQAKDSQGGDSQANKSSEGSDSEEEPKWQPEKRLRPRKKVHYILEPIRSPSPKRSRIDDGGSSSEDEADSNATSSDA